MHTSANLSYIPFLGSTDQSRLQMSSKQLNQCVTSIGCEVPKVIGNEYQQLSNSSRLFRHAAALPGEMIYSNEDIMICIFESSTSSIPMVFETPAIMFCAEVYATKIRYKRDIGPFQTGDILYEYDSFKQGIPTCGYNLNTLYAPFFAFNHEDSIVISESVTERCRSTKLETVLIPIYTYSLFKLIYKHPYDYGFIPSIGRKINGNIIARESRLKSKNPIQVLKSMNLTSFVSVIDNELKFNSVPLTSRLNNAKVEDIRIHRINKNLKLIDNDLQKYISRIANRYSAKIKDVYKSISGILSIDYTKHILSKYYILLDTVTKFQIQTKELVYLIELNLSGEDKSHIGDKFANRYAGKGVVSLILPDKLRPYSLKDKTPIDLICGPITVYSRMNLGQILEGMVAKVVTNSEREILKNQNNATKISETVRKLSLFAKLFNDDSYESAIKQLSEQIKNSDRRKNQFLASIRNLGLYLEVPNFTNFKLDEMLSIIENKFNCQLNEDIVVPRKTLQFIKDKLKCDIELPKKDLILKNKFVAPVYTLKLKQEAKLRVSARDFGSYKSNSKQPSQGRNNGSTLIGQASKIGQMEFEALLSSNALRTVKEFRTVKSDSHNLKHDLALQEIISGEYILPNMKKSESSTRVLIDSYIKFLNG